MVEAGQYADVKKRMLAAHQLMGDRSSRHDYLNVDAWWRAPDTLADIGAALAHPFLNRGITLVISPAASGIGPGALTAVALGAGFAVISKAAEPAFDSDRWLSATTAPDYRDRHLTMAIRRALIRPSDRVLAVDDVVDTGGQLGAVRTVVERAEATWVGASVVVDTLELHAVRRRLALSALIHGRELD